MKSIFLFRIALSLLLLLPVCLQAQPEFRSDVQKEFDENGNITRFDSCWSWFYKGEQGFDFDTVFDRFFQHRYSHFNWDHFPAINDSILDYSMYFNFPDSLSPSGPHTGFPYQLFDDFPAFPDFENHFREYLDRMNKFLEPSPFKADTILYYQHRRPPPVHQKNSSRPMEI
jgi:hypothetical protein